MKIAFTVLLLVGFLQANSQNLAVTLKGDTVILNEDGTWEAQKRSSKSNLEEIELNPGKFTKPSNATKMIIGGKGIYEVWYDPSVWNKVASSKYNKDAEIALEMSNKLAYAVVIYEKIEIPLEPLLDIAIENARPSAPDIRVVKKEYRMVNGTKVAFMQMEGTIDGVKATYYSYYYSNTSGTWQFHTVTMTNMFKQFKKAMEDVLNGLVIK